MLAEEVRTRFGANKHALVTLHDVYEDICTGCDCCGGTDHYLIIECGDHEKRFDITDGLRHGTYYDWLDEPRRRTKQEAAARASREREEATAKQLAAAIGQAAEAVEAEGYGNDREWHDKLMRELGVKGYQQ